MLYGCPRQVKLRVVGGNEKKVLELTRSVTNLRDESAGTDSRAAVLSAADISFLRARSLLTIYVALALVSYSVLAYKNPLHPSSCLPSSNTRLLLLSASCLIRDHEQWPPSLLPQLSTTTVSRPSITTTTLTTVLRPRYITKHLRHSALAITVVPSPLLPRFHPGATPSL